MNRVNIPHGANYLNTFAGGETKRSISQKLKLMHMMGNLHRQLLLAGRVKYFRLNIPFPTTENSDHFVDLNWHPAQATKIKREGRQLGV